MKETEAASAQKPLIGQPRSIVNRTNYYTGNDEVDDKEVEMTMTQINVTSKPLPSPYTPAPSGLKAENNADWDSARIAAHGAGVIVKENPKREDFDLAQAYEDFVVNSLQ